MGLLDGKSAVVTGVGPGIGRAVSLALAAQGANVALGARTESALKEVANEVESSGGRAVFCPTNIADAEQCATLAKTAADAFGKIDVVVQNAFMHGPFAGAHDTDPEDWRRVFKVNVQGTLQMIQACLPYMTDGGSIVVTNSMALRTSAIIEGPYAASKAAMHSMVRTLAQEIGSRNIRVNSVLPGWVHGPSLDIYFELQASERGTTPQQVHDDLADETSLKRLVTPEDVANAIVFLASPLANGITGIALDVNAGHYLP
jgi:NAD(P)-dependent dehydrogenase (short-subunit alcohol dehydrogenase family)